MKNSTARSAGSGGLLSSSKSPHGQGAFFEPLHKKPSPRQGPRRVGVRASHGQSGYAPSGILKVFLVLPEGEENFIRSPVGDLKRFIAWAPGGPYVDIQEGLRKKNLKLFFVA